VLVNNHHSGTMIFDVLKKRTGAFIDIRIVRAYLFTCALFFIVDYVPISALPTHLPPPTTYTHVRVLMRTSAGHMWRSRSTTFRLVLMRCLKLVLLEFLFVCTMSTSSTSCWT
jgi:hypothetical protein